MIDHTPNWSASTFIVGLQPVESRLGLQLSTFQAPSWEVKSPLYAVGMFSNAGEKVCGVNLGGGYC